MKRFERLMQLHRLMDEAGDGTGAGESGGGGSGGEAGNGGGGSGGEAGNGGGEAGNKPTDAEAKLLKEVMNKKAKLQEAEGKINHLTEQLKRFEGIDPDAVRALLAEKQEAERKELEKRGDWDKLRQQMVDAHTSEKNTLVEQLGAKDNEVNSLRAQIAEMTVGTAFSQSKFIADELVLTPAKTRVVYGSHFEFKDGAVVAYDKPAGAADRTMLIDGKGDPLSFDEALRKIIDADPEKDRLTRSKVKQGAGSSTSVKAKDAAKPAEVQLSGRARIAAALAKKQK